LDGDKRQNADLFTFQYHGMPGTLGRLPAPETPFGLDHHRANDIDLQAMAGWKQLKLLKCGPNVPTAALKELAALKQLKVLQIRANAEYSLDKVLGYLGGLPQLEVLSLIGFSEQKSDLPELAKVTKLRKLHVFNSALTDPCLKNVAALREL